jgi:hypothetical protein
MAVLLLMIVASSAFLLPSNFSCYMDGKICQGVDKSAKVRGDSFTLTKMRALSFPTCAFSPTPPDALLEHLLPEPTITAVDNRNAILWSTESTVTPGNRHIRIEYHEIRDLVSNGEMEMRGEYSTPSSVLSS